MSAYKLEIAECLIRMFVGILFLFQGYDKIFKIKISGVVDTFLEEAEHIHIHKPLVTLFTYCTSFIELICGALLIIGLFTNYALLALGFDLVLVCFAFSIIRPMWDMQYVFPRLLLITFLLFLPNEYNKIALDYLLNIK
ncbi:MAG TPA: DoxX family protein [Bacteroidia bacterium]|nr:DoxX family protein [Bacteroidia bacterium]